MLLRHAVMPLRCYVPPPPDICRFAADMPCRCHDDAAAAMLLLMFSLRHACHGLKAPFSPYIAIDMLITRYHIVTVIC